MVKTQPFDAARTLALAEAMSLVEAARVGRSRREAAPMVWWGERLDDAALPGMYAGATHYVSASFGEGWDHPMTEACAMGLGLVAPRHTAYLDYLCEPWVRWVDVDRVAAFADDPPLEAIARVAAGAEEIFAGRPLVACVATRWRRRCGRASIPGRPPGVVAAAPRGDGVAHLGAVRRRDPRGDGVARGSGAGQGGAAGWSCAAPSCAVCVCQCHSTDTAAISATPSTAATIHGSFDGDVVGMVASP